MKHTRRRLRLTALASATIVACSLVANAADEAKAISAPSAEAAAEVRSPFEEANAVQRQMRVVVANASRATFAVTAFATTPIDAALWQRSIDADAFATLAETIDRSCGTAFAIDERGTLLTSEHVVGGATSVWVTSDDGRVLPALVVGTDPRSDLAVLRVPTETSPLPIADDAPLRGDVALTMGNPAGLSTGGALSACVGTVSATGRSLPALSAREKRFYDDLIQVTTPLATGNSGGPLIDLGGRAVGVMCATVDGNGKSASIGFAVALSPEIRHRISRLARGIEVVYGYVGVACGTVEEHGDGSHTVGAKINRVDASGAAAGVLMPGDVILSYDSQAVENDAVFGRLASSGDVDRDVPVVVLRDGKRVELTIRPRKREPNVVPVTTPTQRLDWAGVTFANADGGGVRVTAIVEGVDSPFTVGTRIARVNGAEVPDVSSLLATLHANAGKPLDVTLAPRSE